MIPHEDPEETDMTITLETVFTFATGADHEPPLGFENTPEIHFETRKERFLPYASTCGPTLFLPIVLVDPDSSGRKWIMLLLELRVLEILETIHFRTTLGCNKYMYNTFAVCYSDLALCYSQI